MTSRRAQKRLNAPRFLRQVTHPIFGTLDLFHRGPIPGGIIFAVPALDDTWPSEVKNAVDRRRRATLYGRCDCGTSVENVIHGPGDNLSAVHPHEDDCPASDEQIIALFRRYGITP